jgi:hypothetical protein
MATLIEKIRYDFMKEDITEKFRKYTMTLWKKYT